jgi:uncharacterized Zn finger protein (UPF0148 family)
VAGAPLKNPKRSNAKDHEMKIADEANLDNSRPTVIGADPDFKRLGDEIICPACQNRFPASTSILNVICPACKTKGFQFTDNVPTCPGCGTRGLCAIIDGVHWKMWVPFPPNVMQKFQEQARERREVGNNERAHDHWKQLSERINQNPKTIRNMDREQLAILRQEIIDAVWAQGTTSKRAQELVVSLPTSGDSVMSPKPDAPAADLVVDESAVPYLEKDGNLVIPHNCPKKYR